MRLVSPGALLLTWLAVESAFAQSGPNVTLQLPSFQSTGVNTTVIVPDRGASPLAAQRQAFYGRSMYGPRRQSPIGSSQAGGGTQVSVQVHDPSAAEAQLLRSVRERRATWQRGSLAGRSKPVDSSSGARLLSVAEIRRRQATDASATTDEAARLLAEARRARAQGQSGAAAVYYQMAARRSRLPSALRSRPKPPALIRGETPFRRAVDLESSS